MRQIESRDSGTERDLRPVESRDSLRIRMWLHGKKAVTSKNKIIVFIPAYQESGACFKLSYFLY